MNITTFTTPIEDRFLDDYTEDATYEFGPIAVEESEVIAFGKRFDPQPFHIDPEAAKHSSFHGLIASGWHTASLMMRLFVDHYLTRCASLGSPGVDQLRWLKPVHPGDELVLHVTVSQVTRSRSKPDRGVLHSHIEVLNQRNEVVMTMKALNLVGYRQAGKNVTTTSR